jgi:hypothetical protein
MEKRNWLVYVVTYLAWAVVVALGFWLLLVSRQVFLHGAARYVGDDIVRGWQARFYDKVFLVVAAAFVLALFTLSESYLRNGIARRNVLQRFAKITSIELLLLFVLDAVLVLLQGVSVNGWLRWFFVAAELVAGIVLLFVGRRRTTERKLRFDDKD